MSEIEYNYRTIQEIIQSIKLYHDFGLLDFLLICFIGAIIVSLVVYICPGYKTFKKLKKTQSEKDKKKLALKQILIQKEVEEEIENELREEAQEKSGK